jgi:eukaryotic-like serine/threonine-protein kinase
VLLATTRTHPYVPRRHQTRIAVAVSEPIALLATALDGRYRIERELGTGGMATVYLAHDLRHNRKVAVKVLRGDLTASGDGARFVREIEIAAQLQHPNILPLHESGEARVDGTSVLFFVMPYVEGQSLRQRLLSVGALPVAEALKILIEVVDALAYAHAHGVVHRDIKPDNVMLSSRHALVADFGVAKAVSAASGRHTVTTAGVALGTPAYMAPEQVTADPHIDHRADIYAVGVVAYELLTGSPPFTGGTMQQVLAAHVTATPAPIRSVRPEVPSAVERVVMKCLAKDPAERWQSAGELLAQLEPLGTPTGGHAPSDVAPAPARARRGTLARAVVGLAVIAVTGAVAALLLTRKPPPLVVGRATQVTSEAGLEIFPAISPDGRVMAYAAGSSARMRIYLRPVRGGRTLALSTDTAAVEAQPRWSPDGEQILYLSRGGVWVASSLGGAAREIVFPSPQGEVISAAWSRAGDSIAVVRGDSLLVVSTDGRGGRFAGTALEWHSCVWSRVRDQLACVSGNRDYVVLGQNFGNLSPSAIVIITLANGRVVPVTDSLGVSLSPQWSSDGSRLFFVSNRDGPLDVYAVSIGSDGRPRGRPDRVTTGLGAQSISFNREGNRLTYAAYREEANLWSIPIPSRDRAPVTIDGATQLTSGSQVVETMAVSRDERWIFYDSNIAGSADVYRMPVGGGEPERLTSDPSHEFYGVPSPDGAAFAFHSPRSGTRDLYVQRVGEATAQRVTTTPMQECCAMWSPDGQTLAYTDYLGEQGIFLVRRDSSGRWGTPTRRLTYGFGYRWSPDGSLIALTAGRRLRASSPSERLVVIAPDSGAPRTLHTAVDTLRDPIVGLVEFARDGAGVYFKSHDVMGRASLWLQPLAGGRPTMLVRFDDFARPSYRSNFAAGAGRFFFTINDRQSDVWVAELAAR